jgi:hypothetical protein
MINPNMILGTYQSSYKHIHIHAHTIYAGHDKEMTCFVSDIICISSREYSLNRKGNSSLVLDLFMYWGARMGCIKYMSTLYLLYVFVFRVIKSACKNGNTNLLW